MSGQTKRQMDKWMGLSLSDGGKDIDSFSLFLSFQPCCSASRILVPLPGIEPGAKTVKALSPKHWTTKEPPTLADSSFIHPSTRLAQFWSHSEPPVLQDYPGGPVVKTLSFQCRGHGFSPWWGKYDSLAIGFSQRGKETLQCSWYKRGTLPFWFTEDHQTHFCSPQKGQNAPPPSGCPQSAHLQCAGM